MTDKTTLKTSVAALAFELALDDGSVTNEAHLLPPGPFRAVDGRPYGADWQMDAVVAARVIQRQSLKKTDTLVDYEHQSLRSEANGQPVPAAGWFKELEWREGRGLYAANINWTEQATRMIAAREYRYISAVFTYAPSSGEVLEIISVALTNTPALDGLDALADLARKHSVFSTEEEADMADEKQVAALTSERDGLKTQVTSLTAERDGLKTQLATLTAERDAQKTKLDALEKEKADAALASEKAKHAELLTAALNDGRLTPAQKAWAEKQSLADLTEYLEATNPLAVLKKQTDGKDGGNGLTQEELEMCKRMGVTPEDFAKAKGKC